MPCENKDRKRPITTAYRTTAEDDEAINLLVAASGMTKQDYIVARLKNEEVTIVPSKTMYYALRNEIRELCKQLNRFRTNENPPEHLLHLCDLVFDIFLGLRGVKTVSEVDAEDAFIKGMKREI